MLSKGKSFSSAIAKVNASRFQIYLMYYIILGIRGIKPTNLKDLVDKFYFFQSRCMVR